MVYRHRREGNLVLPGERVLCDLFGVSRITVRKGLAQLESDGMVWRDRKTTRIHPPRKQRGRYVFCVSVREGEQRAIVLAIYRRLWEILARKSKEMLLEIELAPFVQGKDSLESYLASLQGADVLFVSLFEKPVIESMYRAGLPVVALEAFIASATTPRIVLDNRMVGEVAAEYFYAAGCRRPVVLNPRDPDFFSPFRERREGFCEWFQARGVPVNILNTSCYGNDLRRYVYEVAGLAGQLPEQGFDALFLLTDEWIEILLWELFLVPEKTLARLKIIAFDATGQALHHAPVITTVSNGNDAIADEVLSYIQQREIRRTGNALPHFTAAPAIQPGETC